MKFVRKYIQLVAKYIGHKSGLIRVYYLIILNYFEGIKVKASKWKI